MGGTGEQRKRTIYNLKPGKCTGCTTCFNTCPQNAIEMRLNDEGFLYPYISDNCIDCGLCERTCPIINFALKNPEPTIAHAVMLDDETRMESSSGGVFTALARYVFQRGGYVCGAAWGKDFSVKHMLIDNEEDLPKLRGSKYVQSYLGNIFYEIKSLLGQAKYVMFVGTPCQVDGLQHFLGKKYINLLTVDLLCRATPSVEVFKKHLSERFDINRIQKVNFRDKRATGWGHQITYTYEDGKEDRNSSLNSVWIKAFETDIMNRKSCYRCVYSSKKRVGDITLGDFWGISSYDKDLDDRKGTSAVFINTEIGEQVFKSIKTVLKKCKEVPASVAFKFNSVHGGIRENEKRETFFNEIKKSPFDIAVDRAIYGGKTYDVGIAGWWNNCDYGGVLSYYALNKSIQKLGYRPLMIEKSNSDITIPNLNTIQRVFAKKHYEISRVYTKNDLPNINYSCKMFITGAGRMWDFALEPYSSPEFFLSFVNDNRARVAYASSFGAGWDVKPTYVEKYKPLLKKYDEISVGDDYAVEICKNIYDVKATYVCDPVFLCNKVEYEELALSSDLKCKDALICFLLEPNYQTNNATIFLSKMLGRDIVTFTGLQNMQHKLPEITASKVLSQAPVEDLLSAYNQAGFILTDSFYGTCLAIVFNKPFISIINKKRGAERIESLMRKVGLGNHIAYQIQEIVDDKELFTAIDYNDVNRVLKQWKDESLNWLKKTIDKGIEK